MCVCTLHECPKRLKQKISSGVFTPQKEEKKLIRDITCRVLRQRRFSLSSLQSRFAFVNQTSTGGREIHHTVGGWGSGYVQDLISAPSLSPTVAATLLFYNCDLCWANVQMVFFVSASRLWSAPTWAVTAATPDLQTHHFPSVTAHVSDFTLTRERRLKRGTTAWMADGVCLVSCSAIGGFRRELIREEQFHAGFKSELQQENNPKQINNKSSTSSVLFKFWNKIKLLCILWTAWSPQGAWVIKRCPPHRNLVLQTRLTRGGGVSERKDWVEAGKTWAEF